MEDFAASAWRMRIPVVDQLRREHPYMKTATLEWLADGIVAQYQYGFQQQQEALPIYYGENEFKVNIVLSNKDQYEQLGLSRTRDWVRSVVGESAKMVRKITIKIEIWWDCEESAGKVIAERAKATYQNLAVGSGVDEWDENIVRKAFSLEDLGVPIEALEIQVQYW